MSLRSLLSHHVGAYAMNREAIQLDCQFQALVSGRSPIPANSWCPKIDAPDMGSCKGCASPHSSQLCQCTSLCIPCCNDPRRCSAISHIPHYLQIQVESPHQPFESLQTCSQGASGDHSSSFQKAAVMPRARASFAYRVATLVIALAVF